MIHYVLSARRRRKQVSIFLVNAAPQLIYAGCILVFLFLEPSDLKQAHWITLLRFAKTTLRDFNNQLGYQGQRIGPDRRPQRQTV